MIQQPPSAKEIGILEPTHTYATQKLHTLLEKSPYPTLNIVKWPYFRRVFRQDESLALVSVRLDIPNKLPVFITATNGDIDQTALLQSVAHVLGTNDDSQRNFLALLENTPTLWEKLAPVHGTPLLRTPTPFEALITVIIEQHIAWKAARRAQRVLIEWANQSIAWQQQRYYAFPIPTTTGHCHT